MDKKQAEELTDAMMVADALLRLRALENLLIAKGVFTKEEFQQEMENVTTILARDLLKKANVQGDIEEMIGSLKQHMRPKPGN